MWKALSARDWDSLKTFLSDDCIYLDMPVGPAAAARGPEDIVKRLKIGLEPLASYENFDGLMLDNGADVMYEHHEEWHWPTGESAVLKFVTRAPRGERQDHAVEGLLGHGRAGQPSPRRPGWKTSPTPTCRGCSTRPAWSEEDRCST